MSTPTNSSPHQHDRCEEPNPTQLSSRKRPAGSSPNAGLLRVCKKPGQWIGGSGKAETSTVTAEPIIPTNKSSKEEQTDGESKVEQRRESRVSEVGISQVSQSQEQSDKPKVAESTPRYSKPLFGQALRDFREKNGIPAPVNPMLLAQRKPAPLTKPVTPKFSTPLFGQALRHHKEKQRVSAKRQEFINATPHDAIQKKVSL